MGRNHLTPPASGLCPPPPHPPLPTGFVRSLLSSPPRALFDHPVERNKRDAILEVTRAARQGFLYRRLPPKQGKARRRRLGLHSNFTQAELDEEEIFFRFHYAHYSPLSDAFRFRVHSPLVSSEEVPVCFRAVLSLPRPVYRVLRGCHKAVLRAPQRENGRGRVVGGSSRIECKLMPEVTFFLYSPTRRQVEAEVQLQFFPTHSPATTANLTPIRARYIS